MSTLTIRVSRSSNPHTPDFYRLHSAFNSYPTSRTSLYKTGDLIERDIISNIELIRSILKPDDIALKIDTRWSNPIVSADTYYTLTSHYPTI